MKENRMDLNIRKSAIIKFPENPSIMKLKYNNEEMAQVNKYVSLRIEINKYLYEKIIDRH
ncbi:hypothetical protein NUSPORA_01840 [Nucleospora cyclopteri]